MREAGATDGVGWVEEVTRDAVRHFAWGIGDDNPLWLDPDYASQTRWAGVLAPPSFPYAVHESTVAPGHGGRPRRYRSADWRWFDAIRLGVSLEPRARLEDTETVGAALFQHGVLELGGASGSPLARAHVVCERPAEGTARPDAPARRYSADELSQIEEAILAETRRGGEPRWFEDTPEGSRLPPRTKGPLSIMDIVAWCAGALGVPAPGAPVSEGGLLDEVAPGPQLVSWFAHLVTDWAGDDAFLHRLAVAIDALPGLGSTTRLRGAVTHRFESGEACAVEAALEAVDLDDRTLATGRAVVLLPSRSRGPVSLPLAREVDRP